MKRLKIALFAMYVQCKYIFSNEISQMYDLCRDGGAAWDGAKRDYIKSFVDDY